MVEVGSFVALWKMSLFQRDPQIMSLVEAGPLLKQQRFSEGQIELKGPLQKSKRL